MADIFVTAAADRSPLDRKQTQRDDRNYDHNTAVEFSWTIPGYPGYWFMYVRSVISHTDNPMQGSSTVYRFDPVNYETQDPHKEGWRA